MYKLTTLIVLVAVLAFAASDNHAEFSITQLLSMDNDNAPTRITQKQFAEWIGEDSLEEHDVLLNLASLDNMRAAGLGASTKSAFTKFLEAVVRWCETLLPHDPKAGEFFGFLPMYIGNVVPNGPAPLKWSSPCFDHNEATVSMSENSATIEFNVSKASGWTCSDYYLLATVEGIHLTDFFFHGTHKVTWNLPSTLTETQRADIKRNGFRVFRFRGGKLDVISSVYKTAMLYLPGLTNKGVPEGTANLNREFLKSYVGLDMPATKVDRIDYDESFIHSGDYIGILRLDGLDPMIGWGMGGFNGHSTVALRLDGELYIAESNTVSSYWPTDGIQITPWNKWIEQAHDATYQVVHLPLSAENRKAFNTTAAYEFFKSVEGTPYGFHNFLMGWIDTEKDNYPCLPPEYTYCLAAEHVNVLFSFVDKLAPAIGDLMWNESWNKRIGTTGLRTAEIYEQAYQKGISYSQLPTIVEEDSWKYHDGPSYVCDVFVCMSWKAGGLFGDMADDINCTEFTPWDVYALDVFDKDPVLPPQCSELNPNSKYCQILGKYELTMTDISIKAAFPHMAERCPGLPPHYERPDKC
eukprot:GFYU01004612.1.p1 GENE.GFYU01004612.1~~GFYU01004612.1.p1  ORF type:complete len:580 (+),score=220.74 GFYU01004612.1:44-1783(+)